MTHDACDTTFGIFPSREMKVSTNRNRGGYASCVMACVMQRIPPNNERRDSPMTRPATAPAEGAAPADAPVARLRRSTREVLLATGTPGYCYRIDLDRIRDAADLLGWLLHLSGKQWVTAQHMADLIEAAARHNGIEVDYAF